MRKAEKSKEQRKVKGFRCQVSGVRNGETDEPKKRVRSWEVVKVGAVFNRDF